MQNQPAAAQPTPEATQPAAEAQAGSPRYPGGGKRSLLQKCRQATSCQELSKQ